MFTRLATVAVVLVAVAAGLFALNHATPAADAHCQMPCGIYDDPARISQLLEDAITVEKSINQMSLLEGKTDIQNMQQFVRWTNNKEEHASKIITTVSAYFLAQKIKPVAPGAEGYDAYLKQLADHHAVIVAAMKAKQQATPAAAMNLKNAIHTIQHYWDPSHSH